MKEEIPANNCQGDLKMISVSVGNGVMMPQFVKNDSKWVRSNEQWQEVWK